MATKTAYVPTNLPDMSQLFSWGLRVSQIEGLFFVTGLADMKDDGLLANSLRVGIGNLIR